MISMIVIDYFSAERTLLYIKDFMQHIHCSWPVNMIIVDHSINHDNFERLCKGVQQISEHIVLEAMDGARLEDQSELMDACLIYTLPSRKIILCRASQNFGFAKGSNLGANLAKVLLKSEYLIFSNNDLLFEGRINLDLLIEQFRIDASLGLIGPRVVGIDGLAQSPGKKLSIWKRIILFYGFYPISYLLMRFFNYNITNDMMINFRGTYCYRLTGAFMIFGASTFFEIEGFDEATFLYAEELIIAEKLIRVQKKTLFYKDFKVIHEEGFSTNRRYSNISKLMLLFESQYHYYKEYIKSSKLELQAAKLSFGFFLFLNRVRHFRVFLRKESREDTI